MGMYHKNRFAGPGLKRELKKCTSKRRRQAVKKSCREEFTDKITLTRKSHNVYGVDAYLFS